MVDDLASDGAGNRELREGVGRIRAEDRLLVDEAPQPAICVGQVRFDQARLGLVGRPADNLACNCRHPPMVPELLLTGRKQWQNRSRCRAGPVSMTELLAGVCH